jgi:hypothetical protein
MAFVFAYSLDGDNGKPVTDLPLDTAANYKTSGTNGVTKGDLVFQSGGLLRRNGATTGTAIGVLEDTEFTGLIAQGQPYAATNSSFTASATNTATFPNGIGKVRLDKSNVYRVPVKSGSTATNANIGVSYAISVDATGDQTVDIATTTTPAVTVRERSADGKFVFVTLV